MSSIASFRILVVVAVSLALAGAPQSSFAQRGGFHGGGGGFHGGGSGFHGGGAFHGGSSGFRGGGGFRGGNSFGNFRGGNFGGFSGGRGLNGFRGGRFGGFRGFRGYYPGFYSGFGFGFGFGPYWGGYGYPYYGYSPWWGPSPYAYYSPYGYGDYPDGGYADPGCDSSSGNRGYDDDGCAPNNRIRRDNRDCYDYRQKCAPDNNPKNDNAPARPSSEAAPEGPPAGNYLTVSHSMCGDGHSCPSDGAKLRTRFLKGNGLGNSDANAAEFPPKNGGELRPAVRNAIAALRAMPPAARERQLNSGRYASFSPEERELLTKVSQSSFAETMN